VAGQEETVACPWVPDAAVAGPDGRTVPPEIVWAALDCPGGWTIDMVGRPSVLGRIAALVEQTPRAGGRYVVVGRLLGVEGRKAFTVSSLYDEEWRQLAQARHVWVTVDPATVLPG